MEHSLQITQKGKYEEVPEWFPGARLNYAENLLYRNDDCIACTAGNELGVVKHYTFRQLREMVREMAAAMRVNGLKVGDRVAGENEGCHDASRLSRGCLTVHSYHYQFYYRRRSCSCNFQRRRHILQ